MGHLEANLTALQRISPDLASIIAQAGVPAGFESVVGTDGTATFCHVIPRDAGDGSSSPRRRVEWFGATSMPAASAAPIATALNTGAQTGNCGVGLSIGTGYEWRDFASRVPYAHPVYVYEPEAASIKMALTICDLSDSLGSGKIVLITGRGEEAATDFCKFLERHSGYEIPSVLHPLPTLVGERRNVLLAAGEQMVRRATLERQQVIAGLAAQMAAETKAWGGTPLALVRSARFYGERSLDAHLLRLGHALLFEIDRHDTSSVAFRAQAILEKKPRTILSDLYRSQLLCVPSGIPVETWIAPLVGPAYWEQLPAASSLGKEDKVIVHVESHETLLREKGFPQQQVELRPLTLLQEVLKPVPAVSRRRVALIADLVSVEPETLGVTLPTHLAVFNAAKEIIADEYLTAHFGAARDILRRALSRAGVKTEDGVAEDPSLQEPMLRMVRNVLVPTIPLLTLARKPLEEKIPLVLVGDWTGFTPPAGADCVIRPFARDGSTDLYGDVALVVHLSPWGAVSPVIVQGIAAGVAIVSPVHPTDADRGSLAQLLRPDADFAHPQPRHLVSTVKSLLQEHGRRDRFAASARQRLLMP